MSIKLITFVVVSFILSSTFVCAEDNRIVNKIYQQYEGNPCVLLLNRNQTVGCKTGKNGVSGVLHLLETKEELDGFIAMPTEVATVVVLPSHLLNYDNVFFALNSTGIVTGVIILELGVPEYWSPDSKNPQSEIRDGIFEWNKLGTSDLLMRMPFPIWKFDVNDTAVFYEKSLFNKNATQFPYYAVDLIVDMNPKSNSNSELCLNRGTCDILGGHSTVTTMYPRDKTKEIVLVTTAIDSAALFQKNAIGANAEMSGTVSLLAAIDSLKKLTTSSFTKQPVFAFFDGEAFGYLGSNKFIKDIQTSCENNAECEIDISKITNVIEMRQVGGVNADSLYIHQDSNAASELVSKLHTVDAGVSIKNGFNDELPPSSLSQFVKQFSSFKTNGVVITDHEKEFTNKFYHSMYDDDQNVNADLVCKSANFLAKSVYMLSNDAPSAETLNELQVNCTLVSEMLHCFTKNQKCNLAIEILPSLQDLQDSIVVPNHYVSVYRKGSRSVHQKFIHDWVFDAVAHEIAGDCSDDSSCSEEQICLRGKCKSSATQYYDAYSTSVEQDSTTGAWTIQNNTSPIWTESYWSTPSLRLYQIGDPTQDIYFGIFAIVEVIITLTVVYLFKKIF